MRLPGRRKIKHYFPVNLHNYSILADDRSVQFGVMSQDIQVGDYAYRYLCNTSSKVDLTYLQPVDGPIGRCFTLITPDGERTFGISPGLMNDLYRTLSVKR